MTRAPLPWRLLSAALNVIETGAVLAVGAVVVVRALARGARPEEGPDDDCDERGRARGGPDVIDACGAADCQHASLVPDPGPIPHCITWLVLPGGRTVGMSPLGGPLAGGNA